MEPPVNPFAALSLIVAPAILTNASSVLAMSTSNRLARAVDRGRELSKQLEGAGGLAAPETARRLFELGIAQRRTLLLLAALRSFYIALGSFASATLISLFGAVLIPFGLNLTVQIIAGVGVVAGMVAVGALVNGSAVLVRETRLVVSVLQDRAANLLSPAPLSDPVAK